ncbi:DUF1995 family protein [Trichothermofontia sp.]
MVTIPQDLDEAIAQAKTATIAALEAGYSRLQVELAIPELKIMPIAEQFLPIFADYGSDLKVVFPDAGAAALARRDWGPMAFEIRGLDEIRAQLRTEDRAILVIEPSAVEVGDVEKLCTAAGDRPVVLLNPRLEDVATIGIGYAGRQLRERFLNTLESCYYFRPLEGAVLFRCYPTPWQVWQERDGGYALLAEMPTKPVGDILDQILIKDNEESLKPLPSQPSKAGFLTNLERFLRALNQ